MKARKKSIHARLYRFTYGSRYGLPDSLCPYFWKLVVSLVWFVPNLILQLPVLIYNYFAKEEPDDVVTTITNG